jgi:hypothetical protein
VSAGSLTRTARTCSADTARRVRPRGCLLCGLYRPLPRIRRSRREQADDFVEASFDARELRVVARFESLERREEERDGDAGRVADAFGERCMNTVQILAVIAAVSYAGGALLTLSLCKVAGRGSRMEER